ncbi:MAG: DNA gyrase/topoisomerase IV subunit A [Bacteroidales bacterium]|nr:DNA gyrase/topoisomerase IV subunit A [Bacteroidales bacterium]
MEEDKTVMNSDETSSGSGDLQQVFHIKNMFQDWYLDYASYANLDRAIPYIDDGLKPVQRRILHSMWEMDDGRYNKVANIVGNTMKYHPHGDSSIYGALVTLGQKELLVDCQGNWGNILTGDDAAAGRYIEARLSKFALDVAFSPKVTEWKLSYDGRNKEPVALPVKFPLLLAQGTLGLGVGFSSLILPHNFNELIDASIDYLQGRDFQIYPDFPTGGFVDVREYNDGIRNKTKVLIRAKILQQDKRNLVITEIPYTTTTQSLIEDISKAVEKGRLKITKILDKTAEQAEIILQLAPNTSPDQTIDALYAFTQCQVTINPITCVVVNREIQFTDVKSILRHSADRTVDILRRELEILLGELSEKWHWISLEKIFFEKRIYKELEKDQASFEAQISDIERAFDPYRSLFRREITREDVLKLTEKPVRKISKFDIKEAERQLQDIEVDIDEVRNNIEHIIDYTIQWFRQIKKKYGAGRERRTEIRNFENIKAASAAVANQKLYVNSKEGFIGTNLKKDENVVLAGECSDVDEIIVFHEDGSFLVTKVAEKVFVGPDILAAYVFNRNDDRTIFNMVYQDGPLGFSYVKRFAIGGVSRDKRYDLTKGTKGSKVLYFTMNKNGEAETVRVTLRHKAKLKKPVFDYDFSTLAIKGRQSMGNILTKYPVRKIELQSRGASTLNALSLWFDESIQRLNTEQHGRLLGEFVATDKLISFYKAGYCKITGFDLSLHFDEGLLFVEKFNLRRPISVLYYDKEQKKYFLRRSLVEESDKKIELLCGNPKAEMFFCSIQYLPQVEITYTDKQHPDKTTELFNVAEMAEETKLKTKGKRLSFDKIYKINELEPLPYEEAPETLPEDTDELSDMDAEAAEAAEEGELMERMIRTAPVSEDVAGEGIQMNLFDD